MIKINLLPKQLRAKRRAPFVDRFLFYIIILLIGQIVFYYFINMGQKQTIAELDDNITTTKQELKKLESAIKLIDALNTLKGDIQTRLKALEALEAQRPKWVQIMENIATAVPEFTWLNQVKTSGTHLTLTGNTYSIRQNAQFLVNLIKSEIFDNIDLAKIDQTSSGAETIYSFEIGMSTKFKAETQVVQFQTEEEEKEKGEKQQGLVAQGREKLGMDKEKAKEAMAAFQH